MINVNTLKMGDILYTVYVGPNAWLEPQIREYRFAGLEDKKLIVEYEKNYYKVPVETFALTRRESIEKSINEFEKLYRNICLVVPALKGLLSNEQ